MRRRRDDLRDHVAGTHDDHVVAEAQVLAREVLLVVQRRELHGHAADVDRLEHGERVQVAELAEVPLDASSFVTVVVGGNFQAIAQRGSRPTTPSRRWSSSVVDLHDDAVDLEVQRAAALLPGQAAGDDRILAVQALERPWRAGRLRDR